MTSRGREAEFRALVDGKAKPPGALGKLEALAVRLALIADSPTPRADHARLYVFAGDHGLNQAGVSAYPSAVTAALEARRPPPDPRYDELLEVVR